MAYKRLNYLEMYDPDSHTNVKWCVLFRDSLLISGEVEEPQLYQELDVEKGNGLIFASHKDGSQLLGVILDTSCYEKLNNFRTVSLRLLSTYIEREKFENLFLAKHLKLWFLNHRYCGSCGLPLVLVSSEWAVSCDCGYRAYPRISPAVIVAIRDESGRLLLARGRNFTGPFHSLIAGFLEAGETLEQCVRREVMEEVGIELDKIVYFGSQPWPFPDALMVGFFATTSQTDLTVDPVELECADWYELNNLPELPGRISIARRMIDTILSHQV
jgi:NAD+ diphosphatase